MMALRSGHVWQDLIKFHGVLTSQVLQHSSQVHGRASTDTRCVLALLQVPALLQTQLCQHLLQRCLVLSATHLSARSAGSMAHAQMHTVAATASSS
jgi:hypothetical protein